MWFLFLCTCVKHEGSHCFLKKYFSSFLCVFFAEEIVCLQHISYPKLGVIWNFNFMLFFLFVFGAVREQIICYACTYTHLFLTYIPGKTKSAHHSVFAAFHTHLQASVTHWDMSWDTSLCDEAGPGINVKPKKKGLIVRNVIFFFFFILPLLTCTTTVLQAIFTDVLSLRGMSHRAVGYS